jgi:hypothetical protein
MNTTKTFLRRRGPKYQAFVDAGGDNSPPADYLVFLEKMRDLHCQECGKLTADPYRFTRFVLAKVEEGYRYANGELIAPEIEGDACADLA